MRFPLRRKSLANRDFFCDLVDVSDIFNFFLLGEGGRVRGARTEGGGGIGFLLKIPGEGGMFPGGGGAGGCLWRIGALLGGGGAKYFFSEAETSRRRKWVKMVITAEFPAIPSSAMKIASERQCVILVHSAPKWCDIRLGT